MSDQPDRGAAMEALQSTLATLQLRFDGLEVMAGNLRTQRDALRARHESAITWAREGRGLAEELGADGIALAYSQFIEKLGEP